jgi:hypothetical protein
MSATGLPIWYEFEERVKALMERCFHNPYNKSPPEAI